jgi:regulator of sigma E protease
VDLLAATDFTAMLGVAVNILWVALGLGLVIFFHELGHFAVAKWCDVQVERFSLGFGPILASFKRGETEYAFSAIPFGGYVKMLGQDDMDPSQLSNEEIALDPRSYSAKSVRQRMAIISAGVIMNIITGMLFFAGAFHSGVEQIPSIVGGTVPGSPAWKAKLDVGDDIRRIGDRETRTFGDIMRGVALTTGKLKVSGMRADGQTPFAAEITPDEQGTRRIIGVSFINGLKLAKFPEKDVPPVFPGTPAANAKPALMPADKILRIGDTPLEGFAELQQILADNRSEPVTIYVQRQDEDGEPEDADPVKITIGPVKFRTLGLTTDIGTITAIQDGSPAAGKNGLQVGDKILRIDGEGEDVGTKIDPLELPDLLARKHGQEVKIDVSRPVPDADPKTVTVTLVPENRAGWTEFPTGPDVPITIPAIGIAYHVTTTVLKVAEGGPAAKAGILEGERITAVTLTLPKKAESDGFAKDPLTIETTEQKDERTLHNFGYAFWMLQRMPTRKVELTVENAQTKSRKVTIVPSEAPDWYVPNERGMRFFGKTILLQADNSVEAIRMGVTHTQNSITDIYLTLRNLFGGRLSPKELHGPVGIAKVAYSVAREGLPGLLLFLGFLSINLAVLNFLPIPVLDGGHMVFLCWEAVTRKKPSERVLIIAQNVGLAFILGLMVFVLYLDLFVHR